MPQHHRTQTARTFERLTVHAAPGIHEFATTLIAAGTTPQSRILEIGAGSGALTARLRLLDRQVVPTDLEPPSAAVTPLDIVAASQADLQSLGKFDAAVAIEVFEHLENPLAALRNIHELLQPNGLLIISTPNIVHPHSKLKFFLRDSFFLFGANNYHGTGHITPLPDWLLEAHLRDTGFLVEAKHFAGSFEYSGPRRLAYRAEMAILWCLGQRCPAATGDGLALFLAARKVKTS